MKSLDEDVVAKSRPGSTEEFVHGTGEPPEARPDDELAILE